jgi:hypothetical protein
VEGSCWRVQSGGFRVEKVEARYAGGSSRGSAGIPRLSKDVPKLNSIITRKLVENGANINRKYLSP